MGINHKFGVPGYAGAKTDKSTIPSPETLTGTISHTNGTKNVTGVGTLFLSELQVGQYIYANDTIRKIIGIISDTNLRIESSFGAGLAGVALEMTRPGVYRHVGIKNNHATVAGTLMGEDLPAGEAINYNDEAGLEPIFYDATTSSFLISTIE